MPTLRKRAVFRPGGTAASSSSHSQNHSDRPNERNERNEHHNSAVPAPTCREKSAENEVVDADEEPSIERGNLGTEGNGKTAEAEDASGEEPVVPPPADDGDVILTFKHQNGMERGVTVCLRDTFGTIVAQYCRKHSLNVGKCRFFHLGERLGRGKSPADMGFEKMSEDDRVIDVLTEQTGG